MCGIAGYIGLAPDEALLDRMNSAQRHRGPDGSGTYIDGPVGFAHQRLAVIDREGGHQPMGTPDGRFTLIYNGEVYNHDDLRAELQASGHAFSTRSDTEVVLHALAEWGEEALDRFNGMFALALWDRDTQTLMLARDHFGIKPLHLARVSRPAPSGATLASEDATPPPSDASTDQDAIGDAWLFSSEIRPILATGLVQARPDERSLYRYLCFRVHDDGRQTFFEGIERLLPGEVVTISPTGLRRRSFTTLRDDLLALAKERRDAPHDSTVSDRFREALTRAVKIRLRSDVPVGTSLSGGLDSSAVTALIDELLPDEAARSVGPRQNTFSAVFPGYRNDEQQWVEAALDGRRERVAGHDVRPAPGDLVADLADFVRSQEEPVISSGPYAQYCVMREASRHVTVMLDGQGADELLAGYVPEVVVHVRELFRRHRVRGLVEALAMRDVLAKLARNRIRGVLPSTRDASVVPMLSPSFTSAHRGESYAAPTSSMRQRLVHDLFVGSLPSLLRYEDRNSMRFSVEGRVPFLDPDLVRLVFTEPDASVVGGGWNKRMLREAVRDLLPDSIVLRRNKIGFTTPQNEWFHELSGRVREVFQSESFAQRPYFDRKAVVAAFDEWLAGRGGHDSMVFWRILNVELWLREFCDPAPRVSTGSAEPPTAVDTLPSTGMAGAGVRRS
jgi:asparagine synthase (glutamine-hydrolysing)